MYIYIIYTTLKNHRCLKKTLNIILVLVMYIGDNCVIRSKASVGCTVESV